MKRNYFGTDGIRGEFGGPVINPAFAARLGEAAGRWLREYDSSLSKNDPRSGVGPVVLIGRDTRFSGVALESALTAGFLAAGCAPTGLGVLPTPAVARAVRLRHAALGVVITASHNPAEDNGIKFFGPTGVKLLDADEWAIEQKMRTVSRESLMDPVSLPWSDGVREDYIAAVTSLLPPHCLRGWKIVLDTANGATFCTSPTVLRALGAEIVGIGAEPNGHNINAGVGSEYPQKLAEAVRSLPGVKLGIAHDGDGDRCVLCDENGEVLDGDEIITILATHALEKGTLAQKTVVVTVHSNLGVDVAVSAAGGRVLRTMVGDRYVVERMLVEQAMLGGESSGHIICAEVAPAGDGLVAALKVIEVMLAKNRPLSELRRVLKKFPLRSIALRVREKIPLSQLPRLTEAIADLEKSLGSNGRVLVRYSGTESKLRLLVEGPSDAVVSAGIDALEAVARSELPVCVR